MTGKILVVDDDDMFCRMLETSVGSWGYTVEKAGGVHIALELMKSTEYDLVLLDKNMPGFDEKTQEGGLELLRHIRSASISSEVIMMTGKPTVETAIEALKLGAFDYVHKPFHLRELREKIERLLKYRSLINPDRAIEMYRSLREKVLGLIDEGPGVSEESFEQTLLSVSQEIDKLFSLLKWSEKIILTERDALSNVAGLAEQLKEALKPGDKAYDLAEAISRLSTKRL